MDVVSRKTSSIRSNLSVLRAGYEDGKDVLLEISLQSITVTSTECQEVIMSHPLKRISYATCDPASCLFSFMSLSPNSPPHIQQCHTFRLRTPCQAEELNTIVGTAFRAAYTLQCVQEQTGPARKTGQKIIRSSQSAEDLLSTAEQTKDRVTARRSLVITHHPLHNIENKEHDGMINGLDRRKSLTFPEYSQVFDMEEQGNLDSLAQDSGISSTSESTSSYSMKYKNAGKSEEVEDLSKAPWYQAEIQR